MLVSYKMTAVCGDLLTSPLGSFQLLDSRQLVSTPGYLSMWRWHDTYRPVGKILPVMLQVATVSILPNMCTALSPRAGPSASASTPLAHTERQIAQLNAEVARAQRRLAHLLGQRDDMQSSLTHLRTTSITPINRLPAELLSEVFLHCLPDDGDARPTAREAPVVLTQICAQWREVALSTPQLWSSLTIHLPINISGQQPSSQNIEIGIRAMLGEWLPRAGQCGLSLTLNCPRLDVSTTNALVDCLFATSRQWQRLDLTIPDALLARILALPPTDLPSLEALTIRRASLLDRRTGPRPAAAGFWHAPRLRELALVDVEMDKVLLRGLPLARLRRLELIPHMTPRADGLSVPAALGLLSRAPDLTSCVLALEEDSGEGASGDEEVAQLSTIAHLAQMDIQLKASGIALGAFFDRLRTPMLERVRVDYASPERWSAASFNEMLRRSSRRSEREAAYARHGDRAFVKVVEVDVVGDSL